MIKVPKKLIEETRAIIRFYLFLKYDCGLKYTGRLSAKDSKTLLRALKR